MLCCGVLCVLCCVMLCCVVITWPYRRSEGSLGSRSARVCRDMRRDVSGGRHTVGYDLNKVC